MSELDNTCLNIYCDHMQTDLQAELKQTRPFRSSLEELFVSLQRTAAVFEHALECALKPSGVTATQYNVLRILRGAGDQGLSRLLDRLEDTGYIARARGGDDRRYVTTRITPQGLEALSTIDTVVAAFLDAQVGHLTDDQRRTLIDLLSALRHKR